MCFCMWRILFHAPIHRVRVYSVCVYVAASVCRTWHAYRTAVWSLEYDKQNHTRYMQIRFWAITDIIVSQLFNRCYCLWEKSWQLYPRNSSCDLEKKLRLDSQDLETIIFQMDLKHLWYSQPCEQARRCLSWKHFRRLLGIYVLTRRAPHCTSNPPHWATGQGLSVGCTALRGWWELYLLKSKIHGVHHPLILRPELYSARKKIHFWSGSIYLPVPCNSAQCRGATREEGCLILFFNSREVLNLTLSIHTAISKSISVYHPCWKEVLINSSPGNDFQYTPLGRVSNKCPRARNMYSTDWCT